MAEALVQRRVREDTGAGEEVAAAVTLKPGASATEEELRSFVKERVAPYKYPRTIWITSELPLTATGKILKRELRK